MGTRDVGMRGRWDAGTRGAGTEKHGGKDFLLPFDLKYRKILLYLGDRFSKGVLA